ncbi:Universal stress protein family protein [Filimonas lacunae]|uniref:Universal stress protein family protein n=1 Tax=Filimonas lacunae TaxID=477680 RepID=A0A1N7L934_9BACT|nr:universal stress protein [Filimonas lacunae]SIS70358.1 Universal stress protein family protein [Filimonas lacunae]
MSTIIVVTNFSASSQNALDYVCAYKHKQPARIILLRVLSFSAGFAGDGVSMAAISDVTVMDEGLLEAEKQRILSIYPDAHLETRLVTGQFIEALQDEVDEEGANLVAMGTEGDYNDVMSWDNHILDAFIDLSVPVLMVPATLRFSAIKQIAFACNYKREDLYGPVQTLRRLLTYTQARLHFVHVGATLTEEELMWKGKWQKELAGMNVVFEELEAKHVVAELDSFSNNNAIDLLAIRPHRAGIWDSIFSKSNTRDISHLNSIAVLALRGGGI